MLHQRTISYGINIQYPSNWRADEGDVYYHDYVIDIVSFIAPITNDSEAYSPSLSLSIDTPPLNLNEYLSRITNDYGDTKMLMRHTNHFKII